MCGALPVVGARVLSPFGVQRGARTHAGIDLGAREGTPVYAVRAGRVVVAAPNGRIDRYGNTVVVDHGGMLTLYSHLARIDVRAGDDVAQGEQLGTVGRTAGTREIPDGVFAESPPHLHFEALDRWPVRDDGVGRLELGPVFAELGIVAPRGAAIYSRCGELGPEVARRSGGASWLLALGLLSLLRR